MKTIITNQNSTAIGGFRINGVSPEASVSKPMADILCSLRPEPGYRYILEILVCSVADGSFVTGKGVDVYVCVIQHSDYHKPNTDSLIRKMKVTNEILNYAGYKLTPILKDNLAELHRKIIDCKYLAATRESHKASSISGNLDQVINTLVNNEDNEAEAFSILIWGKGNEVRINTAIFADKRDRISLIAQSFNNRLMSKTEELETFKTKKLKEWFYLEKRLSHLYEIRDISSYSWENIPSILPTSKTDHMTDFVPAQPLRLNPYILDNKDGIHLGNIGNKKFTPPLGYLFNMAVIGRSGSGKTSFLGSMIESLNAKGHHYLVIDLFDSDFRALAEKTDAAVFTMGQETSLQLNPFAINGLSDNEVREFAKEYIMTTLSFEPPLDSFIQAALPEYYTSGNIRNAEEFSKFALLYYMSKNKYGEEVKRNIGGILDSRLLKLQQCTSGKSSFHSESLLKNNSIIELAGIGSIESKAMIVSYILRLLMMLKTKAYSPIHPPTPTFVFIDEVSALTDVLKSDINVAALGLKQFLLDIIKRGRKYGLYLILATQEMKDFESYYKQSHVKVIMNSCWSEKMGQEYDPYQNVVHRLAVGSAICSMPEINKAFLFNTINFTGFKKRWNDDMTLSYMKEKFPQYVRKCDPMIKENVSKTEDKPAAEFSIAMEIAKNIVKYIITKLMDPDKEKVAYWKESFNIREFILKVLTDAKLSEKLLNEIFVEIIILAGQMKEPLVIDYLKEKQI